MEKLLALLTPHARLAPVPRGLIFGAWLLLGLSYWQWGTSAASPKPLEVLAALSRLWGGGQLQYALWVSWTTNLQALLLTTMITMLVSYLTVVPLLHDIAIAATGLRFLSLTGLILMFTLLFSGTALKVALLTFGMTVFAATQLQEEVLTIPKETLDDARCLRMGPWHVVWEVIVLGKLPITLAVLRQNAAMGWGMLTLVEGLRWSDGGLGALMLENRKHYIYDEVFAILLIVLVVGLLQDYGLASLTRWLCPYSILKLERK